MSAWNDIAKYVDSNSHICQVNGDGGDSLNRMGCYLTACAIMNETPVMNLNQFYMHNAGVYASNSSLALPVGRYRRNPDFTKWYSDASQTTRDQMVTMESFWAIVGGSETKEARSHWARRLRRALFHFDTRDGGPPPAAYISHLPDPCTPTEFCVLIRACRFWKFWPLLLVLDIFVLIDVLISRQLSLYDADNQLLPQVLATALVWPTPFSLLARWAYARTDAPARLLEYYSEANGNNGIEPLGQIMVKVFDAKIK